MTTVLGIEKSALYCEFDGDAGTLLIYEYDFFYGDEDNGYCTYFNNAGDTKYSYNSGKITFPGYFCVAQTVSGKMSLAYAYYNAVATKN